MNGMPDNETLRRGLELEWQDFIQTRGQTWRTLEIEAALIVGMVGADFKFDNRWVAVALGCLVITATVCGIMITIHHRKGQIIKYQYIKRFEKALGLNREELLGDPRLPEAFKWRHVVHCGKWNTPLFILRMHIALMAFTMIYVGARLIW